MFIDEIDSVGRRRSNTAGGGSSEEQAQALNQILIEMDGFSTTTGVLVIAATNRPDILDPALVRPGRFDRTIVIPLPDRPARRAILAVHAKGKRLGPDVELDAIAGLTRGFSGEDLANVMNQGALLAARRHLPHVTMALLEEAIDRVGMGVSRAQILSDEERTTVAYHEAGHAVATHALPGGIPPHKLSIISRGQALGATWTLDSGDALLLSRSALIDA